MAPNSSSIKRGWVFPLVFLAATAALIGFVTIRWIRPAGAAGDEHADSTENETAASNTLVVSPQGRANIGLTTVKVAPGDFQRKVTVPGRVIERPGHSRITVSAPLQGIVEQVLVLEGEAVRPGEPLFVVRLTHPEVIRRQTDLLDLIQRRAIIEREVARLRDVAASGAVAGKALLKVQYESENLQAEIDAHREGLILLGLREDQIEQIFSERKLVRQMTLTAPHAETAAGGCTGEHLYQVAAIPVAVGEQVESGATLCQLTDYCKLLIQGQAFEQDAAALNGAVSEKRPVSAVIEREDTGDPVEGLRILFLDTEVDAESRALRFYVDLTNAVVSRTEDDFGRAFIGWKFRPGQRVTVLLPVETWEGRIVLPAEAVIQDGAESIVFLAQGNQMTRKAVVERYRDAREVVVENDGTLFPGDQVVAHGAYQLYLMLKNQSGGPVDPHAGHNH